MELRRLASESLARKFEAPQLTCQERSELLQGWEDLAKESDLMQSTLDLLERDGNDLVLSGAAGSTVPDSDGLTNFTWFYQDKDRTHMA